MSNPMSCPKHGPEITKWLDHRGPLHLHTNFAMIGTNSHNVPSWTKTSSILKTQIDLIKSEHARDCEGET